MRKRRPRPLGALFGNKPQLLPRISLPPESVLPSVLPSDVPVVCDGECTGVTGALTGVMTGVVTGVVTGGLCGTVKAQVNGPVSGTVSGTVAALGLACVPEDNTSACVLEKRARLRCETVKFNQKVVDEAARQKQWDAPLFLRSTFSIVLSVIIVFLFATVFYFVWAVPRWFRDLTWQEVGMTYATWIRVFFEIVAFFLLTNSSQARFTEQRATTISTTENTVLAFLFEFSPLTDRLFKQMYPAKCFAISKLDVYAHQAGVDPNAILFAEVIITGNIYRSIETAILQQPIQTRGRINVWRSWFRSAIVQENFVFNRALLDERVVRFIDQNLFPDSPQPKPTCYARLTAEPAKLLAWVVIIVTVLFVFIYWPLAPRYYGSPFKQWELFVSIIETIYLSLVVLLIALENQEMAFDSRYDFLKEVVGAGEGLAISNYPNSLPLSKEFYPCDSLLQTIHVPASSLDPAKVILYNMTAIQVFFAAIQTTLLLTFPPAEGSVRAWRAAFLSPTVRQQWVCSRSFFLPDTVLYIDSVLYDCPQCTSFYEPPPPPRLFADDVSL